MMDEQCLSDKLERIRAWLRYHGDYNVYIDLWGLYGTYNLVISHLGTIIKLYKGDSLEKRLDEVITFLEDESHD